MLNLPYTRTLIHFFFTFLYLTHAYRSCDLDEWTPDQLEIMKIGGNANANLFFKRHGVTDLQSKSEKKYNTKAAQEYKKHLQKCLLDSHTAPVRKGSLDSSENDPRNNSGEWGAEKGLDNLIKSVSGEDLSGKEIKDKEEPVSVFTASAPAPAPAPAPALLLPLLLPLFFLKRPPPTPILVGLASKQRLTPEVRYKRGV